MRVHIVLGLSVKPLKIQTKEFLRLFGYASLEELPELPRYKLDENQQIVIDDIIEEDNKDEEQSPIEAPMPERENEEESKEENKE